MPRLAALALLALAACASEPERPRPRTVWVQDGASAQQFDADRAACLSQAGMAEPVYDQITMMMRFVIFESCMRGKGWREEVAQ